MLHIKGLKILMHQIILINDLLLLNLMIPVWFLCDFESIVILIIFILILLLECLNTMMLIFGYFLNETILMLL